MAVRSSLVKLFSKLELEFHSLEGGGGLNSPGASVLGHLHNRGGDSGGLPQQEVYLKSLEELFILISGGPLVFSLEGIHCDFVVQLSYQAAVSMWQARTI